MAKAQVIVTITTEAIVEVPDGIADLDACCREHVSIDWGGLRVSQVLQSPSVTAEHFLLEETSGSDLGEVPVEEGIEDSEPVAESAPALSVAAEPESVVEPVAEFATTEESDAVDPAPTPVFLASEPAPLAAAHAVPEHPVDLAQMFDDPMYREVLVAAVRRRAGRLIEDIVNEVVGDLEPLLRRYIARHGAH